MNILSQSILEFKIAFLRQNKLIENKTLLSAVLSRMHQLFAFLSFVYLKCNT